MTEALWTPSIERAQNANLTRFRVAAQERTGLALADYEALHAWSITSPGQFWRLVWEWCGVVGDPGEVDMIDNVDSVDNGFSATRFLPDATLNVAENIINAGPGDSVALIARTETGSRREVTRSELAAEVAAVADAFRDLGVQPGDRVAAWIPHSIEAVITMLAAASIGAVFSSTSPDFGPQGVLDRFSQIEPVVLVAAAAYHYGGTRFDCTERLAEIRAGLPSLRATIVVTDAGSGADLPADAVTWADLVDQHDGAAPRYQPMPFDHPWYILYSSGTTGPPKCIVHRTGGVLLQHLKEHRLHGDICVGDRVLYVTTTGWMMWNWLASVPASGATAVLFDGSVFHPSPTALFDIAETEGVTFLGVSAKYIDAARNEELTPATSHDLAALRTVASTGSPLAPEGFEWVYDSVKADVHLASISGGTDICGCFVLGDPTSPVWSGEIQRPALGMASDVFDPNGTTLRDAPGVPGELVCTQPFPSMPIGFWDDPDDARYRAAYFDGFDGVWTHGDFASWTEHGGMVVHGRSDTTLNPGGIRIGTAEIYRAVEAAPGVLESLVFGQQWDGDVRIVLLVRLEADAVLDAALIADLKARVRAAATPRHVPKVIAAVSDLPRTRSGKLVELAVADAVGGRAVRNTEALANPEAIDAIVALPELAV